MLQCLVRNRKLVIYTIQSESCVVGSFLSRTDSSPPWSDIEAWSSFKLRLGTLKEKQSNCSVHRIVHLLDYESLFSFVNGLATTTMLVVLRFMNEPQIKGCFAITLILYCTCTLCAVTLDPVLTYGIWNSIIAHCYNIKYRESYPVTLHGHISRWITPILLQEHTIINCKSYQSKQSRKYI